MNFRILLVLLALVAPTVVNALGLGKLELQSALNQPFKARVELLSATADELDSLKISLADQEAFQRAGIQRTFLLSKLRFRVEETESGSDYIRISSSDSIREPFLNFLLEINWSKGRLYREYTVLLDPPTYIVPGSRKRAVIHPETPVVGIDADDHQVVYDLEYEPGKTRTSQPAPVTSTPTPSYESPSYEPQTSYEPATINYAGSGDYGPAVTGDTLWSIAEAARPDSSVSIQKMMLAILNANPDAFIENNINGLKRGAILQIPDATEIDSVDRADVMAQVNSQHALWDEYRGHIASSVSQQAETSAAYSPGEAEVEVVEEPEVVEDAGEAELRLISETDQASDQSSAGSTGLDAAALNNELALANESIEALFLENAELKDKLTETEGIIDDLKRLIVLKEDELAAMQEQIMIAAAEQESSEAVTDEAMAEEEVEEELVDEEEGEFVEEEEVAEEEMEAEAAEDEVIEEVVFADDQGPGALSGLMDEGMGALSGLKDQGMAMLEKAKANLMILGGVIGGLLLLAFLMIFVSKRRSAKATFVELPEEDFPDFDDGVDSESVTIIPGSEEETILSGDDSPEKVSADKASGDGSGDEEKTVFLGAESPDTADSKDAEPDAFDVPVPAETVEVPQASAPEIPGEDPMEEVNVFLAYEHFDEAETFVRKALEDEPDNLSFHSKLLEVFYAAGNKKSYEDAARVIHEKTGGEGEHWDTATVMWQEMSPSRVLFETPVAGEDEAEELDTTGTGGNVLNIADDGSDADIDLDITGSFPGKESDENMLDITATADSSTEVTQTNENLDMDDTLSIPIKESKELLDDTGKMDVRDVQKLQQAKEDDADGILDVTASIDLEEVIEQSSVEESEGLDLSLDEVSIDLDAGETSLSTEQQTDDANELDISFGDTSGEDGEDLLDVSIAQVSEEASEDSIELDISFDDTSAEGEEDMLDVSISQVSEEASEDSNDLDISFDDTSGEDGILDVSIAQVSKEASEDSNELDISYGDTSAEGEEDILDVSIAQVSEEASDDSNELDISFDDTSGEDDILDVSIARVSEEASEDSNELDISFDDTSGEDDILDVSIAQVSEEASDDSNELDISFDDTFIGDKEDILDVSLAQVSEETSEDSIELDMSLEESSGGDSIELDMSLDDSSADDEDLLDVTSTINFESEGESEGDLLDVSTAADEDADIGSGADTYDEFDLDLGSESPEISLEDELAAGTEDEADALMDIGDDTGDLDFDIGTLDANEPGDLEMDIDSTVEMLPASIESLSMTEEDESPAVDMESTVQMAPTRARALSAGDDEDEDDDDKTFVVPKSSNIEEQSEDDEMASQLDLAKAYIELGDNENAKTILDEIMAQGSENYRKQAEELIGQIN